MRRKNQTAEAVTCQQGVSVCPCVLRGPGFHTPASVAPDLTRLHRGWPRGLELRPALLLLLLQDPVLLFLLVDPVFLHIVPLLLVS